LGLVDRCVATAGVPWSAIEMVRVAMAATRTRKDTGRGDVRAASLAIRRVIPRAFFLMA
jgi:hypothetical protein